MTGLSGRSNHRALVLSSTVTCGDWYVNRIVVDH